MQKQASSKVPKLVWNNYTQKIVLCVLKGIGLAAGPKGEPYVKIKTLKKTFKTPAIRSSDPVWEHYFFFDSPPPSLVIEVLDEKNNTALGVCNLNLSSLIPDIVQDFLMKLEPKKEKHRSKTKGELLVRVLYCDTPDMRELNNVQENGYYFTDHMEKMNTGDLIFYSGRTVLDAFVKVKTGKPFSHVGIVMKISNPLTHHVQLYVVEVTRNLDHMIDAWHQGMVNGVSVFRLEERIYQYFGSGIWWIPMKKPTSLVQEQTMLRWVSHLHYLKSYISMGLSDPQLTSAEAEFLRNFSITQKYPQSMTELWGPSFVLEALEQGHVVVRSDPEGVKEDTVLRTLQEEKVLEVRSPSSGSMTGRKMDNNDPPVWSCLVKKKWTPYEKPICAKLEAEFQKGDHSCTLNNLFVENDSYMLDFVGWKQINNISKHERNIRRESGIRRSMAESNKVALPSSTPRTSRNSVATPRTSRTEVTDKELNMSEIINTNDVLNSNTTINIALHNISDEEKKLLTVGSLLSLPIYGSPVLIFAVDRCLKSYQALTGAEGEEPTNIVSRTPKPESMFVVSPDWDKPFHFTEKLEKDELLRIQRIQQMVKEEEAIIKKLDDQGENSEVIFDMFEGQDDQEMQKDAEEELKVENEDAVVAEEVGVDDKKLEETDPTKETELDDTRPPLADGVTTATDGSPNDPGDGGVTDSASPAINSWRGGSSLPKDPSDGGVTDSASVSPSMNSWRESTLTKIDTTTLGDSDVLNKETVEFYKDCGTPPITPNKRSSTLKERDLVTSLKKKKRTRVSSLNGEKRDHKKQTGDLPSVKEKDK